MNFFLLLIITIVLFGLSFFAIALGAIFKNRAWHSCGGNGGGVQYKGHTIRCSSCEAKGGCHTETKPD